MFLPFVLHPSKTNQAPHKLHFYTVKVHAQLHWFCKIKKFITFLIFIDGCQHWTIGGYIFQMIVWLLMMFGETL